MHTYLRTARTWLLGALCFAAALSAAHAIPAQDDTVQKAERHDVATTVDSLASTLAVGDVIFIRVTAKPFREVALATGSWTNHVGIVIDTAGPQPLIGESTFPFSKTTTLSRFIARSEDGRVAVARLDAGISPAQQQQVRTAATARLGILYDTGFNLHSNRQFCSRYVREVLMQAAGIAVGEVETFAALFSRRPSTDLGFWKIWYFGGIPWQRETVTPASLLASTAMRIVFDGRAVR
jgi:hypothetical protein